GRASKKGGKGGKPFSASASGSPCDLGVHACGSNDFLLCSTGGNERLTENSVLQIADRDVGWQPLPGSILSELQNRLRIREATPQIRDVGQPTVVADHSAPTDPLPTEVRFEVTIVVVR